MDYLEIKSLSHHGIKGQKWGIRRYQNEDGTLTDEGKKRYGTVGLREVSIDKIKKDYNDYISESKNKNEYITEAKKMRNEAYELSKKYDFNQDDGGGGSTKESKEAGAKYMELHERADILEKKYASEVAPKLKQQGKEYITNKYGTYRVSLLKKTESLKVANKVIKSTFFLTLLATPVILITASKK